MTPESFYRIVERSSKAEPRRRRRALVMLSGPILSDYLAALRRITPRRAVSIRKDGRTMAQLVGHILEWERWTILAAGELMAGVRSTHIMEMKGFVESAGTTLDFASVDEFNTYQAAKYTTRDWLRVRRDAVRTATVVHALFTGKEFLPPELLDESEPFAWQLPTGAQVQTTAGWYLWMVTLEHEAIAHAADLYG